MINIQVFSNLPVGQSQEASLMNHSPPRSLEYAFVRLESTEIFWSHSLKLQI